MTVLNGKLAISFKTAARYSGAAMVVKYSTDYNGYGNPYAQGTMSRGDAVGTAMTSNGANIFEIPLQILLGNIRFHFA